MPENVHQRGFKPKCQPHFFIEYEAISMIFAVINHQYIDIYQTKKISLVHVVFCF